MIKLRHILILFFSLSVGWIHAQKNTFKILPDTISICAGDSFLVNFPPELINKNTTYEWTAHGLIIVNARQYYAKTKGRHIVKINDGERTFIDTTYVKINERPKVRIRDTVLCMGNTMVISPKNKSYRYTWSTGETSDTFKTDRPGTYSVKINNKGCTSADTFRVLGGTGVTPNFGKELLICENETNKLLSVKAPDDIKLYWNTGATSSSINIIKEGVYWVRSSSKTCGGRVDSVTIKYKNCDCDIYIPNSFTPNDDDRNDLFAPIFQCEYSYFLITIYDRWGNIVYTSTNSNGKWDGKFKNNPCPDDVYIYKIEAVQKSPDKKITRNGHISLFR